MEFTGDFQETDAVDSLIDWWELAGVTHAVSETPTNWLQQAKPVHRPPVTIATPQSQQPEPVTLPNTLDAFHAWLATGDDVTEMTWPQLSADAARIIPAGPATPALMVICDMPDQEDIRQGSLLAGDAGKLFDAMLAAIGLSRADVYVASVAIARPAGGIFSETDAMQLGKRMSHQISLVAPRKVMLMGNKTSRALLPLVDDSIPNGLGPLNHEGGTVDSITVSHPRLLLKQPAAKMQCWRQLQLLIEAQPA